MTNVIKYRRHFHQYPELSFEEFETAQFIEEKLLDFGYTVRSHLGGTGVVATFDTGREGPVIAFRADMDGLPILEETGLPFESKHVGVMHGCGHDCHMAILLAFAEDVARQKERFKGVIKFIFQPGEESNGGARCIINDGALENPSVDGIFGLHMMPDLPTGTIATKSGYLSATDDEFYIKIHGRGAHSSEPETGVNAIVIASQVISGLNTILATNMNPFDVATFSICKINGGEAINVIPDYAEIAGMVRCIEKDRKMTIREKMKAIASSTASAMGGSAEVEFIPGFPSVNNDPQLTRYVIEAGEEVLSSAENVILVERPHMGSEDFAHYQEVIPGTMFMLGCKNPDCETGALHSADLNVDEDALHVGVSIYMHLARRLCGR